MRPTFLAVIHINQEILGTENLIKPGEEKAESQAGCGSG